MRKSHRVKNVSVRGFFRNFRARNRKYFYSIIKGCSERRFDYVAVLTGIISYNMYGFFVFGDKKLLLYVCLCRSMFQS